MPPPAIKTIKDLIFWEYAKLISGAALSDRKAFPFIMRTFKELQAGKKQWSDILREDLNMNMTKCVYCGDAEQLSNDHIVPKRECHFAEIHNIVKACKGCNSSKGDMDLIEWWGLEKRYEIPRIAMGKYLKMLYICHECRDTLDKGDLNFDGKLNLLDLGYIFQKPCDPEKVKIKALGVNRVRSRLSPKLSKWRLARPDPLIHMEWYDKMYSDVRFQCCGETSK